LTSTGCSGPTRSLALGALALVMLFGCAVPTAAPPQSLVERADREIGALLERVRVYDDPALAEYLGTVAARVGEAGDRIVVIADPTLGAFALPGRRIVLHTGLLSAVESESQLATILARELAHDTAALRPSAGAVPLSAVALGPTAAALFGRDLRLTIAAAIDGYGWQAERAADAEALRRIEAAGYDGRDGARLFETLAADGDDRSGLAEVFFYGDPRRMGERREAWAERLGPPRGRGAADAASAREFERRLLPLVRDNAALDARAGRFALAARRLDRVLIADPSDARAHCRYGELHRLEAQRGDGAARTVSAQRAIAHYRRALELDPRDVDPVRELALLYFDLGDRAQARAAFERYLAVQGGAADAGRIREYVAILGQ
jgi:beta-barrel assembly-enhancing protease